MATKGPAQHNPFTVLALVGHCMLLFILARIEDRDFRNLPKIMPNVSPKQALQTTA